MTMEGYHSPLFRIRTNCNRGGVGLFIKESYSYTVRDDLSVFITSPPEGVARYCFHPVCLSVCVSVCVCPANILVFYISAIRRDIDLKFIQDTYRVVLNSQKNIDLHMSKVMVTGTVHCFLNIQSYHKN